MLHIISALKPEAGPLQDHFDLQPLADTTSIYQNPEAHITLTLSGIGKSAAAAAVARTRDHFRAGRSHAWLNLGIAGHADLPLGQAVLINKVTDAASGLTWYPSRVFATKLPAPRPADPGPTGQQLPGGIIRHGMLWIFSGRRPMRNPGTGTVVKDNLG